MLSERFHVHSLNSLSDAVAMLKRLTFVCIFSLVSGTIVDGNAASTLKMTCSGNLTNTRADGVTLGAVRPQFPVSEGNDRD